MAMENDGKINPSELKIQGLLDRYLRFQSKTDGFEGRAHLDEDSLTAFVEGSLSEREAQPMIAHLVDCSFCRHVTAELVKLDLAFAEEIQPIAAAESQPTRVSEVLGGILSRLFGTNDGAVFAHHEEEEES
ncbi:MAG TPA: hypothetical protein VK892_03780, partial [Pyrinomonadaceae bacterium]|nr:hypothetical protein [Pyrinomonadaceae bacterium]